MGERPLFIGMDLGTFKTSVACSNGRRDVVLSAVGWPRDHVAETMLGRDVVYGDDLDKHRLALDICRPFVKGALKYNDHAQAGIRDEDLGKHAEAARLLVQHAVALTRPEPGVPRCGVIGAPSRATVVNKKVLMAAARDTFDAVMIVPEPFAVAYGVNHLNNTLVVDIGAGTIDICPVHGTYPDAEDQYTVPIGGDSIDEEFLRLVQASCPEARLSLNMVRTIKEKYGFVHDVNEKAVATLRVNGQPREFDVTAPLKQACTTIVEPIIDGLHQVIARLDPEFQEPMLNNILLGGGGSQLKGLDQLIERRLADFGGASVRRVYDSVFAGAVGALRMAMSMPAENWSKLRRARATKDAA